MNRRKKALEAKTSWSEEYKKEFRNALIVEAMSSEEEADDEMNVPIFLVNRYRWRSEAFETFLQSLDKKYTQIQSRKSRAQMIPREPGGVSDKPAPDGFQAKFPWAVNDNQWRPFYFKEI